MEGFFATERIVFAVLAMNAKAIQQETVRFRLLVSEAISSLAGGVQAVGSESESFDLEALRPLSRLLAERVCRPKYGKSRPLVTAEEMNELDLATYVSVDMPAGMPMDVQDSFLGAMAQEVNRYSDGIKTMTWIEWQESMSLIQRLAKRRRVSVEEFLLTDGAKDSLTRATTKKGDYKRSALAHYQATLDQIFDSMIPEIFDSALIDLAGSGSPSYPLVNNSISVLQESMRPFRELVRRKLVDLVDEDVARIYRKANQ